MAVSFKRALMEILADWPRGDAEFVEWLRASAMTTFHSVGTCKRGAPRRDIRQPRLPRVHRRDLDARRHSRSGRDNHEPGALFTGRRHGAGLTPAPCALFSGAHRSGAP
ncbi:MAG TPA: hypothetical protein VMM15_37245 [Bradyrhizobium sp.]|nr:hypothetical protein [Bradyrhizobium sp.]